MPSLPRATEKQDKPLTLTWPCLLHDNHRLMPAHGRLIQSPDYRERKQAAEVVLTSQWKRPKMAGDVVLHARLWFPDHRQRDAGNYRKLVTDALTGIAYADDAQLVSETWERAGYDATNPRVELWLSPAASEPPRNRTERPRGAPNHQVPDSADFSAPPRALRGQQTRNGRTR